MSEQFETIEESRQVPTQVPKGEDEITSVFSGDIDVTPEKVVELTQTVRTGILREITDHGRRLPTDAEGITTALSIMKDMDQTALTTSKLNIEETKANTAAQVAAVADQILAKMSLGKVTGAPRAMEETFELPEVELQPGEDTQGEAALNPDEWLKDRD